MRRKTGRRCPMGKAKWPLTSCISSIHNETKVISLNKVRIVGYIYNYDDLPTTTKHMKTSPYCDNNNDK